ncbi:peptidoglycan recognition family protein [Microvirga sp. VF16]|uniref:peptidoglycan recognition protein family protein n=1 Tax=Microvirga sp. VF16 TaxID=2807101 RepID=UPI00193E7CAE|nr:peptidoglycan recognition family protein [Microvirga sp. VF16]QRM35416.1 N-acetylmuramoyl-L-alanine amidase [Microvirga sp. VF16]
MEREDIFARVRDAEAILSDLRRQLLPASAAGSSLAGAGRGSIDLSSDGKIAIGRNGLDIEYRGRDSCPYGNSATMSRRDFEAVIVHHTAPDHNTDWYVQYQIDGDPARGGHFGYHFYIAPDGKIIQGAPLTKRTNHVKPSNMPQRRPFGRHANNTNAIGITCVGAGRPSFQPTTQQVDSVERLTSALCQTYNINFEKIYGHGEIQTDRHATEGRSAAEIMRRWTPISGPAGAMHEATLPGENDDLDDSPIFELEMSAGLADSAAADWSGGAPALEDEDDIDRDAVVWRPVAAPAEAPSAAPRTKLNYTNQNATRNKKCTSNLEQRIVQAVDAVYGPGCSINIYSGGQDRLGHGSRRTGSIRHDDYGQGGRAADLHVFDVNGRQITALSLAQLGQYWLASKFGGVGHEMRGGGIHLDEWTTPPPGGGMFWTYAYSQNLPWGSQARQMLQRGAQGIFA